MRKSLLFIALCALTFSCTEDFPENQSAQDSTTPSLKIMSLTENDAKQKFAEILSKAIYENIDLYHFLVNVIDYPVMGGDVSRPCNIPTAP
ncbi:hypothetical protein PL587_22560 [Phocaeicola vulgatus]|uniref:hypothetical protein n=2 Tax=Phocaeicola vulgatus TaxID=821 RepID=UPI00230706CA|nr:hypothetical protein [Phocaeicola vulgatus]MDB0871039.1 hypothetical protein [Phocaeicola vulgatus]MDB0914468.1 hypothetical protein [Phocaeicola vulgatus]